MKILQDNQLLTTLISPRFVFQKATTWVFIGVFFLSLSACQNNNQTTNSDSEQITEEESIQEQLILENATLNQVDSQGNKIWTLDVSRAVYDQNQQNANLENVNGELYKNGNIFLKVKANQGTIVNNGEKINLQGKVVATDPRNGAVFRSEKIEWSPADNLIVIPNTLTANHPNFQARSNQGKYDTDQEELELMGNVEGTAEDPPLQVQSEQLNWLIPEDKVISNQPLQVDRYNPETETISDRVTANSGRVNLAQKTVILKNNVEFKSSDPPLQAASDAITWKIESKQVSSQQPIQLVHTADNITLTGNQGEIDLETKIARFQGGVKGISQANQATLFANRLRWNLTTEEMEAQGNVIYQQDDPPLTSKGEEASGVLQKENIVVRGTQEEQVKTELIP